MPLKHTTETLLIFLLGVMLVATGLLLSTLPDLPEGITAWGMVFVFTILYPVLLGPLFRRRRADNAFRLLHWLPAAIALLWIIFQTASLYIPGAFVVSDYFGWAWTLPAVFVGFFLLLAFVLNVIRRRFKRIVLLLIAFVPFVVGGIISSQGAHYEKELANVLWGGSWWQSETAQQIFPSKGMLARLSSSSEPNTGESIDKKEEAWRERLRAIENRRKRIAARLRERKVEGQSSAGAFMEEEKNEEMMKEEKKNEEMMGQHDFEKAPPTKLADSGLGMEAFAVVMMAGYCATVHRRAKRRS